MGSLTVVVGGSSQARCGAVADRLRAVGSAVTCETDTSSWPFERRVGDGFPSQGALIVRAPQLHDAFPSGQSGSTRLVLTQSTYQLQRWLDWMDARGDVALVSDADAATLRLAAPEAFTHRGAWRRAELIDLGAAPGERHDPDDDLRVLAGRPHGALALAFRVSDPEDRLARCRRITEDRPDDAFVQIALGSAYMEVQDLDASQAALERAIALEAEWEAAYYELGKLFLRRDDLQLACDAFAEASRLMPSFSAALSNLGATLGELNCPDEALRAFQQALKYDPNGYSILNNIGVVSRELGRLGESEAAFRQVVALAPDFVFGHYNLGHTLFLQGRYQAALSAYVEGQRRDPERNARQACRLAVVRLAAGDAEGALRDLQRHTAGLRGDQKREVLAEAQEILWALLTDQPALPGWRRVADVVKAELERI